MNDDQSNVGLDNDSKIPTEATCRICKDEGSIDNPLFHPCKCKGSIKYLHESCLMEWIASKRVNISKPGTTINCDICHYPMQFKTIYAANMPEKIPVFLLLKRSLITGLNQIKVMLTMSFGILLLVFGLPLSWNIFGKIYTFLLDGRLPFKSKFWKSLLFGYIEEANVLHNDELFKNFNINDYLLQLLKNIKFSVIQIALVLLLHIALYFQYDMIVRENVFSKMVFHKIGPQYTKDELFKKQLKERFPMMDDETIEHAVKLMKLRNEREEQQQPDPTQEEDEEEEQERIRNGNAAAQAAIDEENRMNANQQYIDIRDEDEDDEDLDPSYVDNGDDSNSELDSLHSEFDNDNEDEEEENEYDVFMGHEEPLHQRIINQQAQNRFNNILDEHLAARHEPQNIAQANDPFVVERPQAHLFDDNNVEGQLVDEAEDENVQPPAAAFVQPLRPAPQQNPVVIDVNEDDNQNGPLLINIKFNIYNILAYFIIGIATIFAYLGVSYFIPSVVGFILLRIYFGLFRLVLMGISHCIHFSKAQLPYEYILANVPFFNHFFSLIVNNVFNVFFEYYYGFKNDTMPHSMIIRAIPAVMTYLTVICIVCSLPNFISKGYSRKNGMKNATRRLLFQVFFAVKCTFKVFTLFFIEIVGFPIFAGLMLDFSFLCPLLGHHDAWIVVPIICRSWPPLLLSVYWCVGTLYMYWFAKYIGMIRHHIIRNGVLFFIRSPDDPNIKILHDSLIHPMSIQISRLSLSIFIYALFIIVGFGFHEKVLFPLILNSEIISTKKYATDRPDKLLVTLMLFLVAKKIIESKLGVKHYVRKYWEKVFEVASSKLRLTSFILGSDQPTERGHVIYRNIFYKIFSSKNAKWSNPDLYSAPKTARQAEILFKEDPNVHAYFIPDGSLIRVPSSDIISRNYVQTLFVPVTKADKLIKPLDLKRIIERNKKNAGEYGYLDEQSTEFDEYSIVYAPPNFTLRYITLIFMLWVFASLLLIFSALSGQFILDLILKITLLPLLQLDFTESQKIKWFLSTSVVLNYQNLSLNYVAIGSILLSLIVDKVYLYDLYRNKLKEHIVLVELEEDENGVQNDGNVGVNDDIEFQIFNFTETLNAVIESHWFKNFTLWVILAVSGTIRYKSLQFNFNQLFVNGLNYASVHQLPIINRFLNTDAIVHGRVANLISECNYYFLFVIRTDQVINGARGFRLFYTISDRPFRTVVRLLLKEVMTSLNVTLFTTIPIIISWFICTLLEYLSPQTQYTSFFATFIFLWNLRLSPDILFEWRQIQHACFTIPMTIIVLYILWQFVTFIKKWFGAAVQNVKDEIYARGRSLENFHQN